MNSLILAAVNSLKKYWAFMVVISHDGDHFNVQVVCSNYFCLFSEYVIRFYKRNEINFFRDLGKLPLKRFVIMINSKSLSQLRMAVTVASNHINYVLVPQ